MCRPFFSSKTSKSFQRKVLNYKSLKSTVHIITHQGESSLLSYKYFGSYKRFTYAFRLPVHEGILPKTLYTSVNY